MTPTAIETIYNGYRFRSRLEARWAVFFDAMNIQWRYETDGYQVDGFRYLPDFYLPSTETWVEVKGDPDGLSKDHRRMSIMVGQCSPLPGVANSGGTKSSRGLLVLGDIPPTTYDLVFHPILRHDEERGISRCWAAFAPTNVGGRLFLVENDVLFAKFMGLGIDAHLEQSTDDPGWIVESRTVTGKGTFHQVSDAYDKARQARFEHGERGR